MHNCRTPLSRTASLSPRLNHWTRPARRTYKLGVFDPKNIKRTVPYPEEHKPRPVEYNGPERLRSAYVLDRMPRLLEESHPLIQDFEEVRNYNAKFYARHQWVDFFDYYKEWKKMHAKRGKDDGGEKKKGGKAEKSPKSSVIVVPDPPQMTEQEQVEYGRSFGSGTMTTAAEVWLKTWKPQSCFTAEDYNDNRYSLNRKLSQRLFLIVKDAKTRKWKFPDALRENPQTLRLTAELAFKTDMDKQMNAYFMEHHPIAHYTNPNDKLDTVFFFHCLYMNGRPPLAKLASKWMDHAWITRQELQEYEFVDQEYKKVAYEMLWEGYNVTPLDP